jgi:hypothetical protein
MKVKELIEKLKKFDPEKLVILSKDSEGNYYDTLWEIDDGHTYKDNYIGYAKITPELKKQGYDEEDIMEGEPCIVLYP